MPSTNNTAPTIKATISDLLKEKEGSSASKYTSSVIGNADTSASLIFANNSFKFLPLPNSIIVSPPFQTSRKKLANSVCKFFVFS